MDFGNIEIRFTFKGGVEKKYIIAATDAINDDTMTGLIAGIVKLFKDDDYPILTDITGKVFCLPSFDEIINIEVKEIKNGR
jgi:hypothetical protein